MDTTNSASLGVYNSLICLESCENLQISSTEIDYSVLAMGTFVLYLARPSIAYCHMLISRVMEIVEVYLK